MGQRHDERNRPSVRAAEHRAEIGGGSAVAGISDCAVAAAQAAADQFRSAADETARRAWHGRSDRGGEARARADRRREDAPARTTAETAGTAVALHRTAPERRGDRRADRRARRLSEGGRAADPALAGPATGNGAADARREGQHRLVHCTAQQHAAVAARAGGQDRQRAPRRYCGGAGSGGAAEESARRAGVGAARVARGLRHRDPPVDAVSWRLGSQ